jgi:hypothetical protein
MEKVGKNYVEPASPRETGIGTAPSAANPPSAAATVENLLVYACVASVLQTGPQIINACPGERRDHHLHVEL